MSHYIPIVGKVLIAVVAARYLYLAAKPSPGNGAESKRIFVLSLGGTVGGFLLGLVASFLILRPIENGEEWSVLVAAYSAAFAGWVGGLSIGVILTRRRKKEP